MQGFTAAQLSTESVSKLLSEEPSAQAGADLEYQLLEAAKAGKKILGPMGFLPRTSLYLSGPRTEILQKFTEILLLELVYYTKW